MFHIPIVGEGPSGGHLDSSSAWLGSRHPQVSRAFGSTSQHLNDVKTQHLFSAIAYRTWPRLHLVGGFKHFLFFHNVWDNPSHWLIFVKIVKTTNQTCCHRLGILGGLPDELQVKRVRWLSRTGRRTPGSTCCIVRITGFGSYGGLRVELPHSWFD